MLLRIEWKIVRITRGVEDAAPYGWVAIWWFERKIRSCSRWEQLLKHILAYLFRSIMVMASAIRAAMPSVSSMEVSTDSMALPASPHFL